MRQPFHIARVGALACALAACVVATAQTMNDSTVSPAVAKQQKQEIKKGDPARWYKPSRLMRTRSTREERGTRSTSSTPTILTGSAGQRSH